jgi:ADP-ribose pyrophosphatase YjhB (NUDIX family)
MPTYFQGNSSHPRHLSVGAILRNGAGDVCVHHVFAKDLKGYWTEAGLDDFYILMRETPEPGESLESTVVRGLREEFGAEAKIIDYIGTLQSHFKHKDVEVEKTTVYFLCDLVSQDLSQRTGTDIESKTQIEWQKPEFLIPLMKEQGKRFGRTDVDESAILSLTPPAARSRTKN